MPDTIDQQSPGLDAETFAALIETVRRFVAERLVPIEAQVAEADQVGGGGPVEVWPTDSL